MTNSFSAVLAVSVLDEPKGIVEKLEAHRKGILHRAFSIFLTDENGNMLIQKRAAGKYHSGGLWSNACCSHPTDDDILSQANERLFQELGIRTALSEIDSFIYRCVFPDGLIEYEYDHILIGKISSKERIVLNPEEAEEIRFIRLDELKQQLLTQPEIFSAWFITAAPKVISHLEKRDS
ncbi:MAG: isopentenyl-diphosphate Delta-isomerase [Acutalibacteraceae bacterium]